MSEPSFQAKEVSIGDLLRTSKPRVPALQRNYSWGNNEWRDLWDDLSDFFEQADEERQYFMGTVVLVREHRTTEILDGQQRLATLTILLSALISFIQAFDSAKALTLEHLGIKKAKVTGPDSYYLTLNQYDNDFFQNVVQKRKTAIAKTSSEKLIKKALDFFKDQIEQKKQNSKISFQDYCLSFSNLILEQVYVAKVVSDPEQSYQVFRVLNDRGKGLSQLDLFRTFLLQKSTPEDRDEIAENWSIILDLDPPAKPDDLLRFYWISRRGDVKARKLFRDIEQCVKAKSVKVTDIVDELFFFADEYRNIFEGGFKSRDLKRWVSAVDELQANPIYAPLLAALWAKGSGATKISEDVLGKLCAFLVSIYVRHSLAMGLDSVYFEALCYKAAKSIRDENDLGVAVQEIKNFAGREVPDEQFIADFSVKSVPRERTAKYLLAEMEMFTRKKDEFEIRRDSEIHLEHIYPRRPKDKADKFADHDDWLWRLGNLTLFLGSANRSAGNRPFDKKKEVYPRSGAEITKMLLSHSKWGKSEIDTRQKEMAKWAAKIWHIDWF